MIFGMIKEGIMEMPDERLGAFLAEIVAIVGVCTLTF